MIQCETVQGLMRAMREHAPPEQWHGFPVLADALQEYDERLLTSRLWLFARMREHRMSPCDTTELECIVTRYPIHGYDWREAFGFAGEPNTYQTPSVHPAKPGDDVTLTSFTRADVAEVVALDEGENDGRPWLCVGRLHDGRWFALDAGCCYTGWDVASRGAVSVATTKDDVIRYGLSSDARARLGLLLPDLDSGHMADK
jgi:hypothetical protein